MTDGIIWLLPEEGQAGPKLGEYTTKFLLMLKVIYDEQMAAASTSVHVITTRAQVQEKMDGFSLLNRQPPASEVRTAIRLLKNIRSLILLTAETRQSREPDLLCIRLSTC